MLPEVSYQCWSQCIFLHSVERRPAEQRSKVRSGERHAGEVAVPGRSKKPIAQRVRVTVTGQNKSWGNARRAADANAISCCALRGDPVALGVAGLALRRIGAQGQDLWRMPSRKALRNIE